MKANGWCPVEIKIVFEQANNLQTLYYLSNIIQPPIKDHSLCTGQRHSEGVCRATLRNVITGQSIHRCQSQSCGELYVDDERVKAIIAGGHTALLDIDVGGDLQNMKIDVVSSNDHSSYVALSHVWADGLGNPRANSLPRCQLAYIADAVRRLEATVAEAPGKLMVWLDTLCCPVGSAPHRDLCLLRMRQIYRDAAHVLIIEVFLARFSSTTVDCVEICARLMFSLWMRRLWTLQEGALARSLWVQLKDKPQNLKALYQALQHLQVMHDPLQQTVCGTLGRLLTFLTQIPSVPTLR